MLSVLVASSLGHSLVWQVKRMRNTLTKWFGFFCVCGRGAVFVWVGFLGGGDCCNLFCCVLFCFLLDSGGNQHNCMRKYNDKNLALNL